MERSLVALLVIGLTVSASLAFDPPVIEQTVFPPELVGKTATQVSADGSTYWFGFDRILWSAQRGSRAIAKPAGSAGGVTFARLSHDGTTLLQNYQVAGSGSVQPEFSFLWTEATGWKALEFSVRGMNADASVIVGYRENATVFPGQLHPWEAVVSRNGAPPVALPKALPRYISGRQFVVSGDGRVIAGYQEPFSGVNVVPVRWVDDVIDPLPSLSRYIPKTVSYDGSRICLEGSQGNGKSIVVEDGRNVPVQLKFPSFGAAPITCTSSDGLLLSDGARLWARDGRYRDVRSELGDFLDGVSTPQILGVGEEGGLAVCFTDSGERITCESSNQGTPPTRFAGTMLQEAGRFKPAVRVSETFREKLVRNAAHDPYAATIAGNSRFSILASIAGFDLTSLEPDTPLMLKVGDFSFTGKLGDDPAYVAGKKSGVFVTTALLNGKSKVVGRLRWSWTKGKLTVTGAFTEPEQFGLAYRRYRGWTGDVSGWVPVEIGFGSLSGALDAIWLKGRCAITPNKGTDKRDVTVTLAGTNKTQAAW